MRRRQADDSHGDAAPREPDCLEGHPLRHGDRALDELRQPRARARQHGDEERAEEREPDGSLGGRRGPQLRAELHLPRRARGPTRGARRPPRLPHRGRPRPPRIRGGRRSAPRAGDAPEAPSPSRLSTNPAGISKYGERQASRHAASRPVSALVRNETFARRVVLVATEPSSIAANRTAKTMRSRMLRAGVLGRRCPTRFDSFRRFAARAGTSGALPSVSTIGHDRDQRRDARALDAVREDPEPHASPCRRRDQDAIEGKGRIPSRRLCSLLRPLRASLPEGARAAQHRYQFHGPHICTPVTSRRNGTCESGSR